MFDTLFFPPMEMNVEMKFTELPNGFKCYYQHWFPDKPRALIFMVHGLGDHIGRYNEFVSHLSCKGYACALYDQRGHGRSEGRRGHFASFDQLISDLGFFIAFSRESLGLNVPMYLMGGSLGGLVCLNYLLTARERFSGILVASAAIMPAVNIPKWQKSIARLGAKIWPSLTIHNRLVFESMMRDPDELAALKADPVFHRRISLGSAIEIERRLGIIMGVPHRIQIPVIMLVGSDDAICDPYGAKMFFDRISSIDKEFINYNGMLHDILHDIGRKRVMEDVERWLTKRTNGGQT